jgi:hypothetical protein
MSVTQKFYNIRSLRLLLLRFNVRRVFLKQLALLQHFDMLSHS